MFGAGRAVLGACDEGDRVSHEEREPEREQEELQFADSLAPDGPPERSPRAPTPRIAVATTPKATESHERQS